MAAMAEKDPREVQTREVVLNRARSRRSSARDRSSPGAKLMPDSAKGNKPRTVTMMEIRPWKKRGIAGWTSPGMRVRWPQG